MTYAYGLAALVIAIVILGSLSTLMEWRHERAEQRRRQAELLRFWSNTRKDGGK